MAPRAFGALLALAAAILLVASLVSAVAPTTFPGWWDGHPRVGGKTIERKEIHVGLLGGRGCNLGEIVACEDLPTGSQLRPVGIVELAGMGLTVVTLIGLLWSTWSIGERRKWLAKLVFGETTLIAIGGAVLMYLGPEIKSTQQVDVPTGLGMLMLCSGIGSAAIAGVIALRLEREPLRLRASIAVPLAPPPQPAPEVETRLRAATPRPAEIQPQEPETTMVTPIPPPPPAAPQSPPPPLPQLSVPPAPRSNPPSIPPPPLPGARAKAPSLPPPLPRTQTSDRPTLAHAIPPPPTSANLLAPTTLAAHDSAVSVPIDADERRTEVRDAQVPPDIGAMVSPLLSSPNTEVLAPPGDPTDEMATVEPRSSAEVNPPIEQPGPSVPAIEPPPSPRRRPSGGLQQPGDPATAHRRNWAPTITQMPLPIAKPTRDLGSTIDKMGLLDAAPAPVVEPAPRASQVPISTAPASLPPPRKTTTQLAGPTPACPQCEAPMTWVEEHLRFYCPQCRMYF